LESEGLVKNGELHQAGYGGFLILPVVWSLKHLGSDLENISRLQKFLQRLQKYFRSSGNLARTAKTPETHICFRRMSRNVSDLVMAWVRS